VAPVNADPGPAAPTPVVPEFSGACLSNVVPALLAQVDPGAGGAGRSGGGEGPEWLPAPVARARQVVLLVIDGLGWEQLQGRAAQVPTLASAVGSRLTSVAPSTTAAALTSLTTGLPPAVHGVVGYRVQMGGRVMNVLGWRFDTQDARQVVPPTSFQPFPAFPWPGDGGRGPRTPTPVVSRADYRPTGFSAAHLGDSVLHGCHTPSALVPEVRRLLAAGEPFVYAYYDGVDRVAHAHGLGELYDAELRAVDRIVSDLVEALPPEAVLVVTADHGQVEVGMSVEVLGGDLMADVALLSGEGRFRWLHVRPGAADDVAAAAREAFGHLAWVRTRREVIDEGWLGGEPVPDVADRLGDVVLAPFEATAFLDPADTGELRLVARHGSLTPAEMYVPLLALAREG
jgi:hypothetical protein